ncbi:hypothetical protein [Brevibacillus brevis]|uniref:Hint domain-containing protein n=1 Tax=Brevibacillus brevis TaxID=1393 RepID=A0ABY9SYQ8_BREBE|nr:hypothetical protein [Brevibacillus brevis]WNC12965.1 hypothetical protein RGB73_19845 [Brevibacillus brevis]
MSVSARFLSVMKAGSAITSDALEYPEQDDINLLIAMDDHEVRKQTGACFTAQLKAHPAVHNTFFSHAGAPPVQARDTDGWIGKTASALVALALAHTSQHGFARTVDGNKAKAVIAQTLQPDSDAFVALARANYEALFPAYCSMNGVSFQRYLDDKPDLWGQRLAARLTDPVFAAKEVLTFDADPNGFYQKLYLLFYKVHRLAPGESERVTKYWDELLQTKSAHSPWTIYEYMLASKYSEQTFMGEVQSAINQSKVTGTRTETLGCGGGMAAHCTTTQVPSQYTYGIPVADWLHSSHYEFITGALPQNVEDVHSGGGGSGCCFTKGTPVLLADGTSKPIEQVAEGDALYGRDGVVVRRSSQSVIWDLEQNELLYGINDYPPFFNASHPFLTKEGWKAISPAAARRINPNLNITRLQAGDILYQVDSTEPFRYKEIEIKEITRTVGDASEPIFSVHLHHDNVGYHAHGFCVAVNYPNITEDSFVRAFAKLSSAERALIRERLDPIMPLLKAGMGNFVQQVLHRSLADPM